MAKVAVSGKIKPKYARWAHTRPLIISVACCVLVAVLMPACAGPGNPKRYMRKGKKAYKNEDYAGALINFQTVREVAPEMFNKWHRKDELASYLDTQIKFGIKEADSRAARGDLIGAWVYYVQVSGVDDSREECQQAWVCAQETRQAIAGDFLRQAREAAARGDRHGTVMAANQSLWYGGGEEAAAMLAEANGQGHILPQPYQASKVNWYDVMSPEGVRTDTIERLLDTREYAPYGMPIYFGEAPRYYIRMGELKVEGMPEYRDIPAQFREKDPLFKLTKKARKHGADALVNVRMWTRRQKVHTRAEMVKFADIREASTGPRSIDTSFHDDDDILSTGSKSRTSADEIILPQSRQGDPANADGDSQMPADEVITPQSGQEKPDVPAGQDDGTLGIGG